MTEVSVLMTVYNGLPYLDKAVDSILSQTLEDFRFVIVDDGSIDGTSEYLQSITDHRVTVLTQINKGTAAAANFGLKEIETPFVARMDADDIAMPHRLATQLAFMKQHPDVGIVGAQVAPIGEVGHGKSLDLPTTHHQIFKAMMAGRHGLAHSSLMIRTQCLNQVGGYWSLSLIDDWDMMLRMGEVSQLANLDDVLLHYRVHQGSLNGKSMWRMHRHIGYAIDRAKRRQRDDESISFEEFELLMQRRPWLNRMAERMHVHAMTQYRMAVAELYGGSRLRGMLRLVYSAFCSPSRTLFRIVRIARKKFGGKPQSQWAETTVTA